MSDFKDRRFGDKDERPIPDEVRVQPHSIEAEEGLLASMLLDGGGDLLIELRAMNLTAGALYKTSHQIIFKAICDMADKELPVDEITLIGHLRSEGNEEEVGGIAGIYAIQNRIETPAHARYYAKIVMDKYLNRQMIRSSREVIEHCYEQSEEPQIISGKAEESFRKISDAKSADDDTMQSADAVVKESMRNLHDRLNNPDAAKGLTVETHLSDLNACLVGEGFGDGQLIVLAARPSVGKSALAGNFGEHSAIDCELPGIIFTFEMTALEWVERIACTRASVDSKRVKSGMVSGEDQKGLHGAYTALGKADLMIDDGGSSTVFDIRRKCHQYNTKLSRDQKRLRFVIIDYLQLIRPSDPKRNRDEQIGEISRNCKQLAKELRCPVILLSQLNRDAANAKPMLHNLRESGNIEQDADVVLLLHRMDSNERDAGYTPAQDDIDIIIAKQRGGPLETIKTSFVRRFTRFEKQQNNQNSGY